MNLSQNFTLREATRSTTATRLGIANDPPPDVLARMAYVAENILEPVRQAFMEPVKVNSFYRSPALNKAVGGKATSQHVTGEAVDFEVPGVPNADVAAWVRDNLTFDQCILEFARSDDPYAGWVHVSYKADPAACRAECLTINEAGVFEGIVA